MHKITRAIILAAGRGERLRPYTDKVPKPLLPIHGKPIIEYTIEALISRCITDIYVVTGYKHRKFKYLKKKYEVKLIHNKHWDKGSNLLSAKCVSEFIENCVILDGDLMLKPQAIRRLVSGSAYSYVKRHFTTEWAICLKDDNKIDYIVANTSPKLNANALYSISYWVGDTARRYRETIDKASDDVKYVDNIAITMPNLYAYEIKAGCIKEFDTVEEYEHEKSME